MGATDFLERAVEMSKAKVDVLAIDTAHGHTAKVMEAIKTIRTRMPEMQIIAGNATFDAARDLIALGIDGLKVGIGPDQFDYPRGYRRYVPQLTAIVDRVRRWEPMFRSSHGGIKYSGDITKALAAELRA